MLNRVVLLVCVAVASAWLGSVCAQPAAESKASATARIARDKRMPKRQPIDESRNDEAESDMRGSDSRVTTEALSERSERQKPEAEESFVDDSPKPDGLVHVVMSEAPIERVLATIEQQTGVGVVARSRVRGQRVSLLVRDLPLTSALERIISSKDGWLFVPPSDSKSPYEIWDRDSYEHFVVRPALPYRVFELRYLSAEEAKGIAAILMSNNIGTVIAATSTGRIVVRDRAEVLNRIADLLEKVDKPAPGRPSSPEPASTTTTLRMSAPPPLVAAESAFRNP